MISGGDKRDRTADLLHAMQALSQLSYSPVFGKVRILCRTHAFVNGGTVFFIQP